MRPFDRPFASVLLLLGTYPEDEPVVVVRLPRHGVEQVHRPVGMPVQLHGVGEFGRGARVAARDQFDAGARVGVDVGFAAEVLDQVDDDFDAAGVGEVELFGPDAEGDLREAGVVELGRAGRGRVPASSRRS